MEEGEDDGGGFGNRENKARRFPRVVSTNPGITCGMTTSGKTAVRVTVYIAVLMAMSVTFGLLQGFGNGVREKARRINCCGNLKQIGAALQAYAETNGRAFPSEGLWQLYEQGRLTGGVYQCPTSGGFTFRPRPHPTLQTIKSGEQCDYAYAAPIDLDTRDMIAIPVAWDRSTNHDLRGIDRLLNHDGAKSG